MEYQMDMASDKDVKNILIGLIIECPMGGNPEDCQLHKKRSLPLKERCIWLKNLDKKERRGIYMIHQKCLSEKENSDEKSTVSPMEILLVEDDVAIRTLINEHLSMDGHRNTIKTASNGLEGLELLKEYDFDLVITDNAMPGMDGDQLVSEIRLINRNIPIIMMTGFGELKEDDKSNEAIDLIMSKPIDLENLKEIIKNCIIKRR